MKSIKVNGGYFLRLEKGEEIISSIAGFIAEQKIVSGTVSAIGAITDVTVGYFDSKLKKYFKQEFNEEYELLSLSGNISYLDNAPMIHAHVVLSKTDYSLFGGHCFSAKVAITVEVFIHTFDHKFVRALDPEIGLNLLQI
jgi:predicted DNA-binding protein with PD1-like motif